MSDFQLSLASAAYLLSTPEGLTREEYIDVDSGDFERGFARGVAAERKRLRAALSQDTEGERRA